jgi:hypothetical protein
MKDLKKMYILTIMVGIIVCSASALANPLVSKEEAQGILQDIVSEPGISTTVSGLAPPGIKYHYSITGSSDNQGMIGSMDINLYDAETMKGDDGLYKTAQDYFNRRKEATSNAGKRSGRIEVEDISGLGDAAYWTPKSYTLHFMSQGAYVSIKINDLTKFSAANSAELDKKMSSHRNQLAEQIAQLIIPRLKER